MGYPYSTCTLLCSYHIPLKFDMTWNIFLPFTIKNLLLYYKIKYVLKRIYFTIFHQVNRSFLNIVELNFNDEQISLNRCDKICLMRELLFNASCRRSAFAFTAYEDGCKVSITYNYSYTTSQCHKLCHDLNVCARKLSNISQ